MKRITSGHDTNPSKDMKMDYGTEELFVDDEIDDENKKLAENQATTVQKNENNVKKYRSSISSSSDSDTNGCFSIESAPSSIFSYRPTLQPNMIKSRQCANIVEEPSKTRRLTALDKWLIDRYGNMLVFDTNINKVVPPPLTQEEERLMELENQRREEYHNKNNTNRVLSLLSPDICTHIASFMQFEDVCKSISRVCRDWYNHCYLGITDITINLREHLSDRAWDALFYRVIIGKCSLLHKFEPVVNERVELFRNVHLKCLAKSPIGQNLCQLHIRNCSFLTSSNGFHKISKYMHSLISLDLSGCTFIENINIYQMSRSLSNLTSLSISGCKNLNDNTVFYISTPDGFTSENSDSRELMVDNDNDGCESVYNSGTHNYFSHNLTYLDISHCNITEKALESVGKYMYQLEHLHLNHITNMNDHCVMHLRSLTNLKSLCIGTDLKTFNITEHFRFIHQFDDDFNIDSIIESLSTHLISLGTTLPSNRYITDYSVINICASLKKMEQLSLKYCLALSSQSISMIANNMHFLKSLDIEGCRRAISVSSLTSLFTQCYSLENLNISVMGRDFGTIISDTKLSISQNIRREEPKKELPISKTMKKLNLSSSMLNDYFMREMLSMTKSVQALDISNNRCISDRSLKWISKNLIDIRELHASNCNVSRSGLRELLSICPKLKVN